MSYLEDIERTIGDHPNRERWLKAARAELEVGQALESRISELGFDSGSEVLEVGCGEGGVAIAIASSGRPTVGLEIDTQRIAVAQKRALEAGSDARFVVGSAYQLPFAAPSFDVVVLENVVEHLEHWPKAIDEAARVLRPGGLLTMTLPNRLGVRTVIADPHWQLPGLVLLPRPAARWAVTSWLKRATVYDVFEMPSLRRLLRECRRAGFEGGRMEDGLYRLTRKADRAQGGKGRLARGLVRQFQQRRGARALYWLYRRFVSEIWIVEVRKPGGD